MFGVDDVLFYSFSSALFGSLGLLLFVHHQSQASRRKLLHAESRIRHIQEHLEHASLLLLRARKSLRGKASLRYSEEKISRAITGLLTAAEEVDRVQSTQHRKR